MYTNETLDHAQFMYTSITRWIDKKMIIQHHNFMIYAENHNNYTS